jgi:transcriptional regulator with XRE-family HTH domain
MRKPRTQNIRITNEARVLRQMRLAHGLTMRQAGSLVGRSDSYISQIENGRMDVPKGERLERLLTAYGGIKARSFIERVRLFRHQATPTDELHDLIERMAVENVITILTMARSILAPGLIEKVVDPLV